MTEKALDSVIMEPVISGKQRSVSRKSSPSVVRGGMGTGHVSQRSEGRKWSAVDKVEKNIPGDATVCAILGGESMLYPGIQVALYDWAVGYTGRQG